MIITMDRVSELDVLFRRKIHTLLRDGMSSSNILDDDKQRLLQDLAVHAGVSPEDLKVYAILSASIDAVLCMEDDPEEFEKFMLFILKSIERRRKELRQMHPVG